MEFLKSSTIAGAALKANVVREPAYQALCETRTIPIHHNLLFGTADGNAHCLAAFEAMGKPKPQMARAVSCLLSSLNLLWTWPVIDVCVCLVGHRVCQAFLSGSWTFIWGDMMPNVKRTIIVMTIPIARAVGDVGVVAKEGWGLIRNADPTSHCSEGRVEENRRRTAASLKLIYRISLDRGHPISLDFLLRK